MNGEVSDACTQTHAHVPSNQDHLVASPKANDTLIPR